MKYIIITLPHFIDGEAEAIAGKFRSENPYRLHLRKPGCGREELRRLIETIPEEYHPRIVLHEHFGLLEEFRLCGVHLNSRNPVAPAGWKGHISTSCHSIEELAGKKGMGYSYLSLSPIFDSISKEGYRAAFSREELTEAGRQGIIDGSVMALGGICKANIREALSYGFGGVMVLGDAWR